MKVGLKRKKKFQLSEGSNFVEGASNDWTVRLGVRCRSCSCGSCCCRCCRCFCRCCCFCCCCRCCCCCHCCCGRCCLTEKTKEFKSRNKGSIKENDTGAINECRKAAGFKSFAPNNTKLEELEIVINAKQSRAFFQNRRPVVGVATFFIVSSGHKNRLKKFNSSAQSQFRERRRRCRRW